LKKLDNDIEYLTSQNEKHEESIKAYKKTIIDLEASLKLYEADSSEIEFIISKDQFVQIEEQLLEYQKEIKFLKSQTKENILEDKTIKELHKKRDDSSMVKVFRESYKKITNS